MKNEQQKKSLEERQKERFINKSTDEAVDDLMDNK